MPKRAHESEDDYSSDDEISDEEEIAAALAIEKQKAAEGGDGVRNNIYNVEVLHDKLEDFGWAEDQAWDETLAITSDAPTHIEDVDDDLERELAFYNQALDAAKQAINKFEEAGIAWSRPTDYFAEMVKSDDHMAKVKEQLLYETKKIEESTQRRKEREAKKFAKQVSAERKKEKAQEKKSAINNVSALRKQRQKSGFAGDMDFDAELDRMDQRQRQNKGKLGERFQSRDKSKKRAARDSKYGFGGPKKLKKQNDAYSAADVDGYKPSKFDDGVARKVNKKFGGGKGGMRAQGGVKKGGKKPQRPGKSRRQQGRNK